MRFVPVVSLENKPLMPTIPSRARRWIKSGKATPFFKKGIFCVRLNEKTRDEIIQPIAIGVDSGIKKEAFTVKSKSHTYLNIQFDSPNHVQRHLAERRSNRKSRRHRKCKYRKYRKNRACLKYKNIPPSIRVRFEWKLKILSWLQNIFPVTNVIVEDISAKCKKGPNNKRWNRSFSPLQTGKNWFYKQINNLVLINGYETKGKREKLELIKSIDKLSNNFSAHCIDSWVLANSIVGGDIIDNNLVLLISPIIFHRRKLHKLQPAKNNIRQRYGGTISLGFKKGSIIKHKKHGICYVGGNNQKRLSLLSLKTATRISRDAKIKDCKFIAFNNIRCRYSE